MKVFGTQTCGGCIELKKLLAQKGVSYTFFDISESDGLAELAVYGLADEVSIPIVVRGEDKVDLNEYVAELQQLPDKG